MSNSLGRLILCCIFILAPAFGQCAGLPDLSGFKQPAAKCLQVDPQIIVTSVGVFQGGAGAAAQALFVVATARPDPDVTVTDHAAISVFDAQCHLVYSREFPYAGEVSFETLHLGGSVFLHVVTISAVAMPADDTIYGHYLLEQAGDGSISPIQPAELQSDESSSVYFGDLGAGRGVGIVETYGPTIWQINTRQPSSSTSMIYAWRHLTLKNGWDVDTFKGPEIIETPADAGKRWPDDSESMGFPLMHYLFGKELG